MRPSRYNLVTQDAGICRITNLLTRTVLEVPPQIGTWLAELETDPGAAQPRFASGLAAALVSGLFVVPDDFDERAYIRERHLEERGSAAIMTVVIAPTMACNMNCHYCYEDKQPGSFADSTERAIVDLVDRRLASYERLHVQWFGGEPLLEVDRIERLSLALRRVAGAHGAKYSAEIITNGFLLSPQIAARLVAVDVIDAQVTFEGDARLHDRVRRTLDGKASYEVLVENILASPEALRVRARVHAAPYNLEAVRRLLEDLAARGVQRRLRKIYFSPLFNYASNGDPRFAFRLEPRKFMSSEEFAGVQVELIELAMSLGFSTGDFLDASYGLCMAMQRASLVINPDGSMAKCYLDAGSARDAVGDVHGGIDEEAMRKWSSYDYDTDAECGSCKFLPVCLGGCPKQEMARADKRIVCTPLRYNFHDRLRLHFSEAEEPVS